MNKQEIMNIIPHRGNMLLIDEVENIDGVAVGKYTVRGDEFFLDGHFPGNPIVPGVILCEMLAQNSCVLIGDELSDDKLAVYAGLNNVKFRAQVKPGDTLVLKSKITKVRYPFYFAAGEAFVGDKRCLSAEMTFAITSK